MNLLHETIEILAEENKTLDDIIAIGNDKYSMTVEEFIELADIEYDNGWGSPKVAMDLYLVGKDFWLERYEYDGSECWEFKQMPEIATYGEKIRYLTVEQVEAATGRDLIGWVTLAGIHEVVEEVEYDH